MDILLGPLVAIAAAGVAWLTRELRRARKGARLVEGGRAAVGVWVRGQRAPYPERFARAHLTLGSGTLVLTSASRTLDLAGVGLVVDRVRAAAAPDRLRDGSVVLVCSDWRGARLELALRDADAALVQDHLERSPELVRSTVPAWSGPSIPAAGWGERIAWALAAFVLVISAWIGFGGHRVDAVVSAVDAGSSVCDVTWTDGAPAVTRTAEVDCAAGSKIGGVVAVQALGWPFPDEAVERVVLPWVLGIGALIPLVVALVAGARRRAGGGRARHLQPASGPVPHRPTDVDPALLDGGELRWSQIVPIAHERAARARRSGLLRRTLARAGDGEILARSVLGARWGWVALAASLPFILPWALGALALQDSTATTSGSPVGEVGNAFLGIVPGDLCVRYTPIDAVELEACAPVVGLPHLIPDLVTVEYATDDPGRIRIVGYDGHSRGLLVGGLWALAVGGYLGWRVRPGISAFRQVRTLARSEVTAIRRYVLVADPDGDPVLLLFPIDGDVPPDLLVPLAGDALGRLPASGTLALTTGPGGLAPDALAVPRLPDGGHLVPSGMLWQIEPDLLPGIVTGEVAIQRG